MARPVAASRRARRSAPGTLDALGDDGGQGVLTGGLLLEQPGGERRRLADHAVALRQVGTDRLEPLGQRHQGGSHRGDDRFALGSIGERVAQHVEAVRLVADQEVFLGREVPEQRARGHRRPLGNLLDGDRVEAPLEEEGQGRRPDPLVALLAVALTQPWCGGLHRIRSWHKRESHSNETNYHFGVTPGTLDGRVRRPC